MKNMKALALLVLAIVAGLAAALYAARWVGQRSNLASTRVVVAAMDIELGSRVNPQMLALADWPSDSVPTDAFHDIKDLQDRVMKTSVLRGEAIVERKLSPAGTQGGLSAVIAEGKRAMTVRVNDVIGVAGFALPGNYVDVLVNAQQDATRGNTANPVSMTVLEHVLVLAVAQEAGRDDTKPKVVSAVTLELAPQDAEMLDLARSIGTLSLVLRNQLDKLPVSTVGITREQLLALKRPVEPADSSAPAIKLVSAKGPAVRRAAGHSPDRPCVDVIRVVARQTECF